MRPTAASKRRYAVIGMLVQFVREGIVRTDLGWSVGYHPLRANHSSWLLWRSAYVVSKIMVMSFKQPFPVSQTGSNLVCEVY